MTINKSVFASRAERDNFLKLKRTWGANYSLYHNLPFLNIFGVKVNERLFDLHELTLKEFTINDLEVSRLKKTSVDYTLCDEDDKPLLCIEFDGLQNGVNIGATYKPASLVGEGQTAWRHEITELKLKVAHAHFFPFFVVGCSQFRDFSTNIRLTIVDGIIGDVLANQASRARMVNFSCSDLGLTEDQLDRLPTWERDALIQDWVCGVEIESALEHNPIYKERGRLQGALRSVLKGMEGYSSFSSRVLQSPLNGQAPVVGVEVTLHTERFGDITRKAWLPNFQTPHLSLGLSLTEEIAHLLALDHVRMLHKRALSRQEHVL